VTPVGVRHVLARFLTLTATRWLPVGLMIPVMVLLPLDRGLSLAEIGSALAVQGFVVLGLELPTGGFTDSLGRRPVLLASTLVGATSYALFLVADSFWWLVAFAALQGVYRALDSGPLEAWYVDAVREHEPEAPIEAGLSAQGTVLGLGVAGGAILSSIVVALDPVPAVDALALPVLIALVVQLLGAVAVVVLMAEHGPSRTSGLIASARETPRAIRDALGLLKGSHVLLALLCVELSWGFGMVTFESLLPVRLSEVNGGVDAAAVVAGPAAAAAWAASAAGASVAGWLARRVGTALAAAALRVLQGVCVILLGVFGGVVGLLSAYLACYVVHGSSNVLHSALLHRQVDASTRATVLSLNSMFAQPAGALGLICLTAVADGTSTSVAMLVGGLVLALAAPLYLPALRQERACVRAT
jgi:predicted MFS family arabinose efflux permease